MFGIRYVKVPSTTYVMHYRNGKLRRQGAGLSFYYFAPTSVIVQVPLSSVDVPFVFTEVSADFQDVTVQGTITYRVADPMQLASLLDYSVDRRGRYISDDPARLGERLVQVARTGARAFIQGLRLRHVLQESPALAVSVGQTLATSPTVTQLGVEVLEVGVVSIKADPEMSRALQAEAREQLLKEADQAIYARRNTAVELERTIRENELQTSIAVAQKERQVRETEMQAEIAVEEQRSTLVETRVSNHRKEAEAQGAALRAILDPIREVDWRTLLAAQGRAEAGTIISAAFEEIARNADRIGQLNISPDLLNTLLASQRDGHARQATPRQ